MTKRYWALLQLALLAFPASVSAAPESFFSPDGKTSGELCELAFARTSQANLPPEWEARIREVYETTLKDNHSTEEFFVFRGKPHPEHENPYKLAALLAAGDLAQAELLRLGYQHKKDVHGSEALVPPEDLITLFRNYGRIMRKAIESGEVTLEDTIFPVFVFAKKVKGRREALPKQWEDYRFVDPLTESFPSPTEFELLDGNDLQFPNSIWHRALSIGKMPFPMGNYLGHDNAHLSDFSNNRALMKATRDWNRRAYKMPSVWDSNDSRYLDLQNQKLRFRVLNVTEVGSLPNIARIELIETLFPSLLSRHKSPDFVGAIKDELRPQSLHQLEEVLSRIEKNQEKLFIRMGGGMRDGYGLERFSIPRTRAYQGLKAAQMDPKDIPPDFFEYGQRGARPSAEESLFGLVMETRQLFKFLESKSDLSSEFFGTREDFVLQVKERIVDCLARIEVAMSMAVHVRLTPEQMVADSTQPTVDPRSPTYRYFDSFLPSHSHLRAMFLKQ